MRFPIPLHAHNASSSSFSDYSSIKVTVFSDDSKDPVLIGDAGIDLRPVFKNGEFDDWVELSYKGRYAGEVYLEMTYYSEAPPPVPALPKEVVSRGLQSRDSACTTSPGNGARLKRRPLPQQPDMVDSTPPPSRGYRHPYEPLPPSTSHGPRPSTAVTHVSRPATGVSRPSTGTSPQHSSRPSTGMSAHSSRPSTGLSPHHNNRPSTSVSQAYHPADDYPEHRPRQRSLGHEGYDRPQSHYQPYEPAVEYPYYHPPDSPTLGRHRSETSLRTLQYYEQEQRPPPPSRGRPRTSLPLPRHMPALAYEYDRPRPVPIENFDFKYRNARKTEGLDEYYQTSAPPPQQDPYHQSQYLPREQDSYHQNQYQPPQQDPYQHRQYQQPPQEYIQLNEPEEIIPVQPYLSPRKQQPSPLVQQQFYSPHNSLPNTPHSAPNRHSYSPHTPQRTYSPDQPQHYSPTPPPHRSSPHTTPTPLKKPTPIRAIDHLPPTTYAPEDNLTPPLQLRRALPTPPSHHSSPSDPSSPLATRRPHAAPVVPAKIPMGMTEGEYWAVALEEERTAFFNEQGGERRLRGLVDDGGGWREVRSALGDVERGYQGYREQF